MSCVVHACYPDQSLLAKVLLLPFFNLSFCIHSCAEVILASRHPISSFSCRNIVQELIETEEKYVKDLEHVVNVSEECMRVTA